MSGLSRMGQNCFGVGTPILSPLPPAGNTAATAGAQRWSSAAALAWLSRAAEAAGSAPPKRRKRGPGSAGPEPPGGAGSMAAGGAAGPSSSGSERPAAARAPGRVARGGEDEGRGVPSALTAPTQAERTSPWRVPRELHGFRSFLLAPLRPLH